MNKKLAIFLLAATCFGSSFGLLYLLLTGPFNNDMQTKIGICPINTGSASIAHNSRSLSSIANNEVITDSGNIETKTIPIPNINTITSFGANKLIIEYRQTGEETLTITADSNILPLLEQTIHGTSLTLTTKPNKPFTTKTIPQYHAVVKSIKHISAHNNVTVTTNDLATTELYLEATNSSTITSTIHTDRLQADISNNSTITVNGHANTQKIDVSNNGTYNAYKLQNTNAHVTVYNNASAQLATEKELHYQVYNNGSITYKDTPEILQGKKYNNGSIKKS